MKTKRNFFLLMIVLVFTEIVIGQNTIKGFSVNPKLGFFDAADDNDGFMGGGEINVLSDKFIYSLDYYRYEEFVLFGPKPSEYSNQIGVMIGKFIGNKFFRFQYQGGIAPFWGLKRTDLISEGTGFFGSDLYDKENFFTVGLVGKVGFKIVPLQFMSIGIDIQANVNYENPVFVPFMISIEIGKLRDKLKK